MKNDIQQERIRAVQRFLNGERQEAIYTSLGQSKAWFYKWVERYIADDNSWSESHPSRPLTNITHTSKDVEEIVKMVRLNLYNHDLFCGVQTILCELEDMILSFLFCGNPGIKTKKGFCLVNHVVDH